jgi:hypothetical protein
MDMMVASVNVTDPPTMQQHDVEVMVCVGE